MKITDTLPLSYECSGNNLTVSILTDLTDYNLIGQYAYCPGSMYAE